MKKGISLLIVSLFTSLSAINLYAAESVDSVKDDEYIQQEDFVRIEEYMTTLDDMFSDLNDTDKILRDETGGWMYGSCVVIDLDGNILGEYDSETDPNSVTVAEAKEIMLQEEIDRLQK